LGLTPQPDPAADFEPNDERMHPYQRGRASITGLMVELRKMIKTGRLIVVVMSRLVVPLLSPPDAVTRIPVVMTDDHDPIAL
jgi:hypothetical protein